MYGTMVSRSPIDAAEAKTACGFGAKSVGQSMSSQGKKLGL
jgi:hypothetical protein